MKTVQLFFCRPTSRRATEKTGAPVSSGTVLWIRKQKCHGQSPHSSVSLSGSVSF